MLTRDRVVPVGHRHARGRGIIEGPERLNEVDERVAIIGKSSGPYEPVALRIGHT